MALLGFLWQLAKCNPYTARLVSGATLGWCEQLASCPLVSLFAQTAVRRSPLEPRLPASADFWNKLLTAGTSPQKDVRIAARVSAMQTVMTGNASPPPRLKSAACRMRPLTMRVADRRRN